MITEAIFWLSIGVEYECDRASLRLRKGESARRASGNKAFVNSSRVVAGVQSRTTCVSPKILEATYSISAPGAAY